MSFVSLDFVLFLALFFALYFVVPKRAQWVVLLVASYVFYLAADYRAVVFLLVTTCTVFFGARAIYKIIQAHGADIAENAYGKEDRKKLKGIMQKRKRRVLIVVLLVNFGILAVLKYAGFFVGIFGFGLGEGASSAFSFLLPLGISFYTFQATGYLIDVFRGRYAAGDNLAKFALFVSFFPQIVQGPISRYDQLGHQLVEPHRFDYVQFKFGLQLILWGYFKKTVIGDRAAIFVNHVAENPEYTGIPVIVSVLLFMAQIYADFSGGIDITRGIAQCCGITLVDNFQRPHFAQSVSEYWRRWHITLGEWMKDYILYPISLSKAFSSMGKVTRKWFGNYWGKKIPTCIAMGIVFMVVGIWHGAAWKYIAFGVYNGGLIMLGIAFTPLLQKLNERFRLVNTKTFSWGLFKMLATFFFVAISKSLVMYGGLADGLRRFKAAATGISLFSLTDGSLFEMGLNRPEFTLLLFALFIFFVVSLLQERGYHLRESLARQNVLMRWGVYVVATMAVIVFGVYGAGYDAANFIYQGF